MTDIGRVTECVMQTDSILYQLGTITASLDAINSQIAAQRAEIQELNHRLFGNATQGLVSRVDLLTEWTERHEAAGSENRAWRMKIWCAVAGSLILAGLGAVYDVWKHVQGVKP